MDRMSSLRLKSEIMRSSYYYVCINSYMGRIVHRKGCKNLRKKEQTFLGSFYGYSDAMVIAKQRYSDIDLCQDCLEFNHKTDAAHS